MSDIHRFEVDGVSVLRRQELEREVARLRAQVETLSRALARLRSREPAREDSAPTLH